MQEAEESKEKPEEKFIVNKLSTQEFMASFLTENSNKEKMNDKEEEKNELA